VVGYLLEERFLIHPVNTSDTFYHGARILVTNAGPDVYHVRLTGDEIL